MLIVEFKLLAAFIILAVTVVAGWYPFHKRRLAQQAYDFPIGEALASGVFLGAGLLHMLSEAGNSFWEQGVAYPYPFLLSGIVFLSLLWLEHVAKEVYEHSDQDGNSSAFAVLGTVMLSIHSILAGAALGLSSSMASVVIIFIAILSHKWAESFALAVYITKSRMSSHQGLFSFAFFALMAPLGVVFGYAVASWFSSYPLLEPIFYSLAAGTFLYLGTLHGLTRSVMIKDCCNLKNFSFVILGFVIMAIVAVWT